MDREPMDSPPAEGEAQTPFTRACDYSENALARPFESIFKIELLSDRLQPREWCLGIVDERPYSAPYRYFQTGAIMDN